MKNLLNLLSQRRRDTLCPVETLLCYYACVRVCQSKNAASKFSKRRNPRKAIITQSVQALDNSACLLHISLQETVISRRDAEHDMIMQCKATIPKAREMVSGKPCAGLKASHLDRLR